MIYVTHGAVPNYSSELLTHKNMLPTPVFADFLSQRLPRFVSLEDTLYGTGDALTLDDATEAAAAAARLARNYDHAVTLFINPYQVERREFYHFAILNSALDETPKAEITFRGAKYSLLKVSGRRLVRRAFKTEVCRAGCEQERDSLVREYLDLLGVGRPQVPDHLRTLTREQLAELAAIGVTIENHGWSHRFLSCLTRTQAIDEILLGRRWLHDHLGVNAKYFAVPYGEVDVSTIPWLSGVERSFLVDPGRPAEWADDRVANRVNLHIPLENRS